MPEPYIKVFKIPTESGGEIEFTSLVIDKKEFDELVDKASIPDPPGYFTPTIQPQTFLSEKDKRHLKATNHIPLIVRGIRTEWMFEKYGISSELMSVIVRGAGEQVLERYLVNSTQRN